MYLHNIDLYYYLLSGTIRSHTEEQTEARRHGWYYAWLAGVRSSFYYHSQIYDLPGKSLSLWNWMTFTTSCSVQSCALYGVLQIMPTNVHFTCTCMSAVLVQYVLQVDIRRQQWGHVEVNVFTVTHRGVWIGWKACSLSVRIGMQKPAYLCLVTLYMYLNSNLPLAHMHTCQFTYTRMCTCACCFNTVGYLKETL